MHVKLNIKLTFYRIVLVHLQLANLCYDLSPRLIKIAPNNQKTAPNNQEHEAENQKGKQIAFLILSPHLTKFGDPKTKSNCFTKHVTSASI